MGLKLGGKAFSLHPLCSSAVKIMAALDAAPKDELFRKEQVAKMASISAEYTGDMGRSEELRDYTEIAGKERLWGNPAAIKELRRQLAGDK